MTKPSIAFYSMFVRLTVENWGKASNFDPQEKILTHIGKLFETKQVDIAAAKKETDGSLYLKVHIQGWDNPKEFILLVDGSFAK